MDLQWQRQIELWLRLMEASSAVPATPLMLRQGEDTYYLEPQAGRALLSLARPLSDSVQLPTLLRLLALLQPEASGGVPMRAWLARGHLWLAATAPQESGAEQWAQLARHQRRLLNRITENSNENQ